MDVIKEEVPLATVKEYKKNIVRSLILIPPYERKFHGKDFASLPLRRIICPSDKEFPYDVDKKRTGIIFGFFTPEQFPGKSPSDQKNKGPYRFGVGRIEAEGDETKFELAVGEAGIKRCLDVVKRQAKQIKPEQKAHTLYSFLGFINFDEKDSLPIEIMKGLIETDEDKKVVAEFLAQCLRQTVELIDESLRSILEEIDLIKTDIQHNKPGKKGKGSREQIKRHIERFYGQRIGTFGLLLREIRNIDDLFGLSSVSGHENFYKKVRDLYDIVSIEIQKKYNITAKAKNT